MHVGLQLWGNNSGAYSHQLHVKAYFEDGKM